MRMCHGCLIGMMTITIENRSHDGSLVGKTPACGGAREKKIVFAAGCDGVVFDPDDTNGGNFWNGFAKNGRFVGGLGGSLVVISYISPTVSRYSGFMLGRAF